MSRRRIVLVVLLVGLVVVAAVTATFGARHHTVPTPPSLEAERQMRAAIISYRVLQEPIDPPSSTASSSRRSAVSRS
jgi:hypothetical protein